LSTLLFIGGIVALVVSTTVAGSMLWHYVNTTTFQALNGCVDQDDSLAWLQEQPYQPSPEYVTCTTGVHRTAIIEAWLAAALLACAVLALIVWTIEQFVEDHVTTSSGLPIYTTRFRAVRMGIGIAAILLAVLVVGVIFPAS